MGPKRLISLVFGAIVVGALGMHGVPMAADGPVPTAPGAPGTGDARVGGAAQVWRVVYNDFPPFAATTVDDAPTGYAIELIQAIADHEGATLTFVKVDNPGAALALMQAGEADLHPALGTAAERRDVVSFSAPIGAISIVPFRLADNAVTFALPADPALRIGVVANTLPDIFVNQNDIAAVRLETNMDLLVALAGGEIDIALQAEPGFSHMADTLELRDKFVMAGEPLLRRDMAIATSLLNPALAVTIERRLADISQTPMFWSMRDRWFSFEAGLSGTQILMIVAGTLAAAAFTGFCVFFYMRLRVRNALLRAATQREGEQRRIAEDMALKFRASEIRQNDMRQILFMVSHDLNSPLVSMAGFVEILRSNVASGVGGLVDHALDRVERNINNMRRLISDIVELKSVDPSMARFEPVSFDDVMADLRASLASHVEMVGATIRCGRLGTHVADRDLMQRALQNMVSNALRHACPRPGMTIDVVLEEVDGWLHLGVRDEGPGIPDHARERIFYINQKVDPKGEGSGLGLAIVTRVAEIHGGRTWVTDNGTEDVTSPVTGGVTRGVTFWLSIAPHIDTSLERVRQRRRMADAQLEVVA